MKIDKIISLTVVGGLLDGTCIEFLADFNCIIGPRGTGKTTVLELIRWALDELPRKDLSPAAYRRLESLIEGNLQGGRVELAVENSDGIRFYVTRTAGDAPIVLDADRQPTAISASGGAFFRAEIFSQNDIETIADHSKFQLELIDSFARDEIAAQDWEAEEIADDIVAHARKMEPIVARLAALDEEVKQLPLIEERLKGMAAKGDETATKVNKAHEEKALRDRETRLMNIAGGFLDELDTELAELTGRFRAEFKGKFPDDLVGGPNGEIIASLKKRLSDAAQGVKAAIQSGRESLAECKTGVEADRETLRLKHTAQDVAFRELIEKHKKHQAQSTERVALERKRNQLKESKAAAAELKKQLKEGEKRRQELLKSLSECRDSRFAIRKGVADRLNKALAPNITVSIQQDGNAEAYQSLIESTLQGAGVKQRIVAAKLAPNVPPTHLAEMVRKQDALGLQESADLNVDQANKVVAAFNRLERLAELETVALEDAPSIRLRVGDQEKDSLTLSTGQKCTTILPILLLEGGNPLLIDQPEDNLDNRFIFETVVDNIEKVKPLRQLIFVTHNPNIPVLGDASRVFVMESDGERAGVSAFGSVDDCRSQIVTLLEGGEEAFRQRGARYDL